MIIVIMDKIGPITVTCDSGAEFYDNLAGSDPEEALWAIHLHRWRLHIIIIIIIIASHYCDEIQVPE